MQNYLSLKFIDIFRGCDIVWIYINADGAFFMGWKLPFSRYSLTHLFIKEGAYPISSAINFTGLP